MSTSIVEQSHEDWKQQYETCKNCGKLVDEATFKHACKKHQQMCCSTECYRVQWEAQFRCCEKAVFFTCVCIAAVKCEVHGTRHHGTHD